MGALNVDTDHVFLEAMNSSRVTGANRLNIFFGTFLSGEIKQSTLGPDLF
jgi:hypothetical protein